MGLVLMTLYLPLGFHTSIDMGLATERRASSLVTALEFAGGRDYGGPTVWIVFLFRVFLYWLCCFDSFK